MRLVVTLAPNFMASGSSSNIALKTFSLENGILDLSAEDEIIGFDAEEDKRINREAPWTKEWVFESTYSLSWT